MNFTQMLDTQLDGLDKIVRMSLQHTFKRRSFASHEILLKKGDICREIHFIESGIVREFSYLEETETETYWFLNEGHWMYAITSFETQAPSETWLQTLEPTVVWSIQKAVLESILEKYPCIYPFYIKILGQYMLYMEKRDRLHRIKSAGRRLETYELLYPSLSNRVKQKHIASFLNITPQQLSRIRQSRRKI